jgi:hypothetical protein
MVGYGGLVRLENVASVWEQYEFGSWNTLGD